MQNIFEMHAEICKVLSNPTRLRILNMLRNKEMSVTELMEAAKLSQANISQHLAIMKHKGIVTSNRRGKHIYYSITNHKIIKAFDIMREVLIEKIQETKLVSKLRT